MNAETKPGTMSDRTYLLDASALLALILKEPGSELVNEVFDDSEIHACNLTEVARKLISKGMPGEEARDLLEALNLSIVEQFSAAQAFAAADLAATGIGLSLGDTVCLTVAKSSGMIAVTADRRWSELDGFQILQVRC